MKNKFLKLALISYLFLGAIILAPVFPQYASADDTKPTAEVVVPSGTAGSYELISPIGSISSIKDQDPAGLSGFINLLIKIAIAMAGAIAVVIIIVNGIQYMGTGSVWEKGESKAKMGTAIGGIVLLLCSYLILYTINPDLVNIKIGIHKGTEQEWKTFSEATEADSLVDNDSAHSTGQKICSSNAECKTICTTYCKNGKCNYTKAIAGVLDPSKAKPITDIKNITGGPGVTVSPDVLEGLKKLSSVFDSENKGYTALVSSGYRPVNRQLELACQDLNRVPDFVAYPGNSNHGTGVAVDIYLKQYNTQISYCTLENSKKMDEMMTKAGWNRYTKEAWHYEYGVATSETRCVHPNCPKATKCVSK